MHKQSDPQELIDRIKDGAGELRILLDSQRAELLRLTHENRELLKEVQRLRSQEAAN